MFENNDKDGESVGESAANAAEKAGASSQTHGKREVGKGK